MIIIIIISTISIIFSVEEMRSAYIFNTNSKLITAASITLNQLKRDSSETYGIQKELNKFYVLLMENKCTAKELEQRCIDFNNSGYSFVKLRFFNKKHNNVDIRNYTDNDILNGAMQRLYAALATYRATGDDSQLKKYRSLFETLLGAIDLYKLAKESSTLIPVTLSGKPGFIYWNVYEEQVETHDIGGMLGWIRASEIPPRFLCQKIVDRYNMNSSSSNKSQIFGFVDTNMNGFLYPENIIDSIPGFYYNELILKLQELKACLRSYDIMGNFLFSYIELGNGRYFFCLSPSSNESLANISTIIFDIIICLCALIVCFFLYKTGSIKAESANVNNNQEQNKNSDTDSDTDTEDTSESKTASESKTTDKSEKEENASGEPNSQPVQDPLLILLSENKKLVLSSVLLGFVLIIYFICVNIFINKFSNKNNREQIYANLNSVIDWIDEGYAIAQKDLSEKWLLLAKDEEIKALNKDSIDNIAKNLKKEQNLDRMFITDKNGKTLYSFPEDSYKNSIFNKLIPVIGRKIATERFGTAESWNSKIDSLMVNSIGQSFSELLGDGALSVLKAFEKFDTVSEIELGNKRHLVFSTVIEAQNNEQLILIMWLDSQHFSQDYLVNKIKDSQTLPENLRKVMLAMVPIHLDNQPYPPEITKYSFSRDITERVNYTKRPANFETNAGGQKFYGVGTMINSIPNYVIFALQEE